MHQFTYDLEGKRKHDHDGKRRRILKGRLADSLTSWCRNSASISLQIGHSIRVSVVQIASRLFIHRADGTIVLWFGQEVCWSGRKRREMNVRDEDDFVESGERNRVYDSWAIER
jgi:hypothetical protein